MGPKLEALLTAASHGARFPGFHCRTVIMVRAVHDALQMPLISSTTRRAPSPAKPALHMALLPFTTRGASSSAKHRLAHAAAVLKTDRRPVISKTSPPHVHCRHPRQEGPRHQRNQACTCHCRLDNCQEHRVEIKSFLQYIKMKNHRASSMCYLVNTTAELLVRQNIRTSTHLAILLYDPQRVAFLLAHKTLRDAR